MYDIEQLKDRAQIEKDVESLETAFKNVIDDVSMRPGLMDDMANQLVCLGKKMEIIGRELQNSGKYMQECV